MPVRAEGQPFLGSHRGYCASSATPASSLPGDGAPDERIIMRLRAPAAMLAASLLGGFALVAAAGGIANAATASSPWAQTSYNAAQSRANLGEKTLTAGTEHRIRFLRNIAA